VVARPVVAGPPEDLLRRSDVSLLAPASFRASLTITTRGKAVGLQVWRSGESDLLVQFLGEADEGKFLLRREGVLYFIAPRARKPIRLNPSYRLSGAASLDEILGTRYAQAYTVVRSSPEGSGDAIVLHLQAVDPKAQFPVVRYVVERTTSRPTRVEFDLRGGKTARVVEFIRWAEGPRVHPARLRIRDELNPQATAEVDILSVEPRPVPAGLFDLADDSERRKLRPPAPDSSSQR
jgi:hypothetical protein